MNLRKKKKKIWANSSIKAYYDNFSSNVLSVSTVYRYLTNSLCKVSFNFFHFRNKARVPRLLGKKLYTKKGTMEKYFSTDWRSQKKIKPKSEIICEKRDCGKVYFPQIDKVEKLNQIHVMAADLHLTQETKTRPSLQRVIEQFVVANRNETRRIKCKRSHTTNATMIIDRRRVFGRWISALSSTRSSISRLYLRETKETVNYSPLV